MCGRYSITVDKSSIEYHFNAKFTSGQIDFKPTYNAAPSQLLPIITTHATGFKLQDIPLGLGLLQSVDVTDRPKVYKALTANGLSLDSLPPSKLAIPDDKLTDDELLEHHLSAADPAERRPGIQTSIPF